MALTSKQEALNTARELEDLRMQRLIDTIEGEIAEWAEAGGKGAIDMAFETRAERNSAPKVLDMYAEAGWDITVSDDYSKVRMV